MNIYLNEREVLILKDLIEQDIDVQFQFIKQAKSPDELDSAELSKKYMIELEAISNKLS